LSIDKPEKPKGSGPLWRPTCIWKVGSCPWRAQVKRKGHGTMVKHFVTKKEAQRWGEEQERSIRLAGLPLTNEELKKQTVGDIVRRYRDVEELHEFGIPSWVDQYYLSQHLWGYDPNIKTRQIKINGVNKNGYEWSTFFNTWKIYIKEKEVKDIEEEIGMATKR
jgi:hypothetical protein